jgi:hypothetical protein
MRLSRIVNQLAVLGDSELNDKVVLKFLQITRPRYWQLVISIKMLLDVSTLSLEEVTVQLRSTKEDKVTPPPPRCRGETVLDRGGVGRAQ